MASRWQLGAAKSDAEAHQLVIVCVNISWVDAFCLCTNLDCNTAIYCCCADDACMCSCLADSLPRKLRCSPVDTVARRSRIASRARNGAHTAGASAFALRKPAEVSKLSVKTLPSKVEK